MKLTSILIVVVILLALLGYLWLKPAAQTNVPMNNKVCPVSGKPVNDEHTYVHEGKEYKLCSKECKQPLSENPEKYLSE